MRLSDYLTNDAAHRNCTLLFRSTGEQEIQYKGKTYSVSEFDKAFPRYVDRVEWGRNRNKGENPDGKLKWVNS